MSTEARDLLLDNIGAVAATIFADRSIPAARQICEQMWLLGCKGNIRPRGASSKEDSVVLWSAFDIDNLDVDATLPSALDFGVAIKLFFIYTTC